MFSTSDVISIILVRLWTGMGGRFDKPVKCISYYDTVVISNNRTASIADGIIRTTIITHGC